MKKLTLFFLVLSPFFLQAQFKLSGVVVDSTSGKKMASVSIENVLKHKGAFTDDQGHFEMEVEMGESLLFTSVGYKNFILRVKPGMDLEEQRIVMAFKPVQLKEVKVKQGPTEYQVDSASRASLYEDAFNYKQSKSVMSPVTSVYQMFSKKHKEMRHFQDQILDMEQQKFIDTRYTPELVKQLLHLNEEDANAFMRAYPMEYEYARGASDLEIKMWIKYNYKQYKK